MDIVQYKNGRQILSLNSLERDGSKLKLPGISKIGDDTVQVGKELVVKISIEKSKFKLVDAFIDCVQVPEPSVDTTTYKVDGCSSGLVVKNETVYIGFKPTKLGVHDFSEITILTRGLDKVFRTMKYSFRFTVVEPPPKRQ